jgi:DNA ligase 1
LRCAASRRILLLSRHVLDPEACVMPDLKDGESVEVKGSARDPYILKNVGGVYSCTCPAWRNQSLPIDRRTCKHLRKYRGDQAEQARLGAFLPPRPSAETQKSDAPPLLLAERWQTDIDLTGWWMSEKLDGVRAFWNGKQFLSRQGNRFHPPDWFTAGLPNVPLDGELWLARKAFQRTVSIVRRHDGTDLWREIAYVVFDAPQVAAPFEERLALLDATFSEHRPSCARLLPQERCRGADHLMSELARIESLGGEGLMLRQPGSLYQAGRSSTLLKVKTFHDAEARVVAHEPGQGRHKGRLGALVVELADGVRFAVGTGLTDAQRASPPPVGSTITFRYQELSDRGVPRFPSFVRVRPDAE